MKTGDTLNNAIAHKLGTTAYGIDFSPMRQCLIIFDASDPTKDIVDILAEFDKWNDFIDWLNE